MNVLCPHCNHNFVGEDELAGLTVHCPHCKKSLTLLAASAAATSAAAPAKPSVPAVAASTSAEAAAAVTGKPPALAPAASPADKVAAAGRPPAPAAAPSADKVAAAGKPSSPVAAAAPSAYRGAAAPEKPSTPSSRSTLPAGEKRAAQGTAGRKKSDGAAHMTFECAHCHQRLSVPPVAAGLIVKCPLCNNRIQVPERRKTERQAWKETDPTNPNFLKSLSTGFGLLLIWFGLLLPFVPPAHTPIADYNALQFTASLFYKHFTVSALNTLFFAWSMSIIFLKQRKIRLQKAALLLDVLPAKLGKKIHGGNVAAFIEHVYSLPIRLRDSLMVNRIRKALELFEIRQNVSDVREMMVSQSEIDSARISGSYTLLRAFLWGIPLLGFIGTVVGLSHAIGGMNFANVDDVGQVVGAINNVTGGLGTAFDATLLGLVLALTLNFPLNALAKQEDDNLHTIDAFCNEVLLPRLKDSSTAYTSESAAIAHLVARSIARSQEKFLTELNHSIEQVAKCIAGLETGVGGLNQALRELGEKQAVTAPEARR
jgi:biopolymer transport protein ExbB/TolQ/DNA-directed RNA polymerase subunit RPC12/RpoP